MPPECKIAGCDLKVLGRHAHAKDGGIYFDWKRFECSKCGGSAVVCEYNPFNIWKYITIKCLNCGNKKIKELCDIRHQKAQ